MTIRRKVISLQVRGLSGMDSSVAERAKRPHVPRGRWHAASMRGALSVRRDAGADLAAHAGAAQPAIAGRVLGEILLVIVLGEVERRRIDDLGGDRRKALGAQRLLVRGLGGFGGGALLG